VTKNLLNTVNQYEALYWDPTLIPFNDRYIIAASNSFLDEAIKDVELSKDIKCISQLAEYGIKIDPSIIANIGKLKFASEYESTIDFVDFDLVGQWLKELECDAVYYAGTANKRFMYITETIDRILSNLKIKLKLYSANSEVSKSKSVLLLLASNSPTMYYTHQFKKIIKMKNSTPITIK
jgi:hydrogenase maturation factor HypE